MSANEKRPLAVRPLAVRPLAVRPLAVRTQAEVAAILGVSLQAVQATEYRALKKLRKYLQERNGAVVASEGGDDEKPTGQR